MVVDGTQVTSLDDFSWTCRRHLCDGLVALTPNVDGMAWPWWCDRWMKQPNLTQARSGSVMFKSDLLPSKFSWVSPNFSPVIADQYLFIFVKLEEDNICLFYNLPFGQTHRYVLTSLAIVKLVLVCYGQVCRYSVLTSLTTKITRSFSILESLKMYVKEIPKILFRHLIP